MNIRILYFARLREVLGLDRETVTLEAPDARLADLLDVLRRRGGAWYDELAPGRNFRLAVNQEVATPEAGLAEGDEVAIFPPVTGG
jgi:molybdopterin synthase sulfur carrier subunit